MSSLKRIFIVTAVSLSLAYANISAQEFKYVEDWTRFVPLAANVGLGLVGVSSSDGFMQRAVAACIGLGLNGATVYSLKAAVSEERPDGSDCSSFPSGHCSIAFLGAELVRRNYGWAWGGGAYALATSVAVMRVVHDAHWWWDTLAGAGIGIASAWAGEYLSKPLGRLLGFKYARVTVSPGFDPASGSPCLALVCSF